MKYRSRVAPSIDLQKKKWTAYDKMHGIQYPGSLGLDDHSFLEVSRGHHHNLFSRHRQGTDQTAARRLSRRQAALDQTTERPAAAGGQASRRPHCRALGRLQADDLQLAARLCAQKLRQFAYSPSSRPPSEVDCGATP